MKGKSHKILKCELIKVEKVFNQVKPSKYFYNLELEGLDDILLLETEQPIPPGLVGNKIKYKLDSENQISEFEFL